MRHRDRAARGWALPWAISLVLALPASAAAQDPGDVAQRVHREGGYPSALPIGRGAAGGSGGGMPGFGGGGRTDRDGSGSGGAGSGSGSGGSDSHSGSGSGSGSGAANNPSTPGTSPDERANRRRSQPPVRSSPSMGAASGLGTALSWVIMVVVVLLLVGFLGWLLLRLRPGESSDTDEAPPARRRRPENEQPMAIPLIEGDPDDLAREGRLEEAIGAVLVRALKRVGWVPKGRQRSLTAREILASVTHGDARRQPLAGVVDVAEGVRFAGHEATLERYERALALLADLPRDETS